MGLLQKLKSTLGLGGSQTPRRHDQRGEVDVTVEHEPAAESEAAVNGPDDGWESKPAGDGSADAAESATEPATDESDEAEEPAEVDEPAAADEDGAGADVPVTELSGIGAAYGDRLADAGVESVADLAGADAASLSEESDISEGRLEGWIEQAKEY